MNVKWLMQTAMLERGPQPTLADAARARGHEVVVVHENDLASVPYAEGNCVLTYGTVEFVKRVERRFARWWTPGAYMRLENLRFSAFAAHHGVHLLNDDFVVLPFAEVLRRRPEAWGEAIFMRPDASTKSFTGFVVSETDFDFEMNSLLQTSHVQPEDLVVVAAPKIIFEENRFVVVRGEVVAGSAYSWDDDKPASQGWDPDCFRLAQKIAKHAWQADTVYTCDVALTDLGPRLVELNSFSAAGLYACDLYHVVDAVSRAAWAEHQGDDL
jgi:hypothetical protein